MGNFFYDIFNSLRTRIFGAPIPEDVFIKENRLYDTRNRHTLYENYLRNDQHVNLRRNINKERARVHNLKLQNISREDEEEENVEGNKQILKEEDEEEEDLKIFGFKTDDMYNMYKNVSNKNFGEFFSDQSILAIENAVVNKFTAFEKDYKEVLVPNYNYCGKDVKLLTKITNNVKPKDKIDAYCLEKHINNYIFMFEDDEKDLENEDFLNKFHMYAQKNNSNWGNLINILYFIKQYVIGQDLYTTLVSNSSLTLNMLQDISQFFLSKKNKILEGNYFHDNPSKKKQKQKHNQQQSESGATFSK